LNISRLFRRAAGRREALRLRRKTARARQITADTDAMLARRNPQRSKTS